MHSIIAEIIKLVSKREAIGILLEGIFSNFGSIQLSGQERNGGLSKVNKKWANSLLPWLPHLLVDTRRTR
jgi:hypothetical protein